jgi:DMSO/TMAO reductase YedYZ molybdopterin-dependent catalytic subunit
MALPPGQRAISGFPRFGTHLHRPPPSVPAEPVLEISGVATIPLRELASLPRREVAADFHCVAGWSATGLRWEGVPFGAVYERFVAPATPSHFVFAGLDGAWSFMTREDALADDVLLADRLNGAPLDGAHGAPLRLVAPDHYGFVNTKHLCRIEPRDSEPREGYGTATPFARRGLQLIWFKRHPRARVWHEERHRHLPAPVLRLVGRAFYWPTRWLSR